MSAADCERWENRLLDLAYGEIEEGDEREVRAHLDGCEHCRRGLEKLTRGRSLARHLEQHEPPAEAMQVVLRAARDKALEIEAARAQAAQAKAENEEAAAARPAPPAPKPKSWWGAVLDVVMAPQFAMATLLLLTVGVGLWWFPGRGPSAGAPPLVSEPATTTARGPEALTPAEPLRFEVDPRTGRVEAHHEGDEEVAVAPTRPRGIHLPSDEPAETGTGEELSAAATVMLDDGESAGVVVDGLLPEPEAPSLEMGSFELGAAESGTGVGGTAGRPRGPSVAWGPSPGGSAPSLPVAPSTAPSVAPSAAPPTEGRSSERAESDEVESPSVDGSTLMAAALLRQARDLVRAGRDRDAIAQYESLLTRYRSAAEAPTAMIELADCYRRTGAISRARGWLERAANHPSVAATARRELLRLDAAPPAVDSDEAVTSDSY